MQKGRWLDLALSVHLYTYSKMRQLEIKRDALLRLDMRKKANRNTHIHTHCILLHFFLSVVLSSSSLAPVLRGLINKAGEDWGACSDKGCSLGESRNLSYHTVRGQRRAAGLSAF